jgi:hypothetical protein
MLKKLLPWVALALLPGYSYSDGIKPYTGYTGNAAANGLQWSMEDVLPTPPGLDIDNVIYRYTIQKQLEDTVSVNVQNENADGTGYIFRETDTWLPGSLSGTQINKVVPVVPMNREHWGDGSITVDGPGSVANPSVVYTYKVDPCYDPQYSPQCPGYEPPLDLVPDIDLSNIYTGLENADLNRKVDDDLIEKKDLEEEEDKEAKEKEELDSKERLEAALAAADTSALFANALAQAQMLEALNRATNMGTYYTTTIPGGTYRESVRLYDAQLPENINGLRNGLAQQLLHNKMVEMQYE